MRVRVYLAKDIRDASRDLASDIRGLTARHRILLVNVMSSPGSGKTTILERTLAALSHEYRIGVIAGDLYTTEDAERLEPWCDRVVQINTHGICHLDAGMICRVLAGESALLASDLLFIENIGNLVCPAAWDLGEDLRVSLLSVTEGIDKPRKYPLAFKDSNAVLITKTDLVPFCDVSVESLTSRLETINPELRMFPVSAKTGEGLGPWLMWLEESLTAKKQRSPA